MYTTDGLEVDAEVRHPSSGCTRSSSESATASSRVHRPWLRHLYLELSWDDGLRRDSPARNGGAATCWHLTGGEIDAAMATLTDDVVALPDGGRPSPTLPENWRTVSRPDRRVFQRADRDHYIVLGDGSDEWLVVLCSQGDRAYPAPLAHRTVAEEADVERGIRELAEESNDLIEPPEGEH